jgi:hypothetical protein
MHGLNMRTLIIALLLASAAAPAHACMWHEVYGVFWDQKPLFPRGDEVVLRVEPTGAALPALPSSDLNVIAPPGGSASREEGMFRTSCDGRADVFKVVEVLHGVFDGSEIAIVYPATGDPFDAPAKGERRIVVGRVLPAVQLEERHVSNSVELGRLIERREADWSDLSDRLVSERVAGPSSIPQLAFRTPADFQVRRFLYAWPSLPPAWKIGFIVVGVAILAGLTFAIGAIARRLSGRARA